MSDVDVLRVPPADAWETSRIGAYLSWLRRTGRGDFASYDELWTWSTTELDAFWASVWDYFALDELASAGGDGPALGRRALPGAEWFPGRTLNYADVLLRMPGRADEDVVVVAESQSRAPVTYTAAELRDAVGAARAGLVRLGVGRGDRVAAYAPNVPETLVLLLATASLGAVFSSCAPEFGAPSVVDRWRQIGPKVVFAVDGYRYGTKGVDRREQVEQVRRGVGPEVVVWLPYLDPGFEVPEGDLSWAGLVSTPGPLAFEPTAFADPLYVLYSSGTTGLPKAITHCHGGIAVEHLKALAFHLDLGPEDRFLWFSTTGWMMWNKLVSGLSVGATIVTFDGDPGSPDLAELWRVAERTGVTYFGTSATFLQQNRKQGIRPRDHGLGLVRQVGSTGSPLSADGFRWVQAEFGPDVQLTSLAGGTDVCTGFLGGTPLHETVAGEIACRQLGCAVAAFGEDGEPVTGSLGELVVTEPMPSMPIGFWGDDDGSRMHEAYFAAIPGVWRHGDWITITDRGTCVVTGRSDATLNRGGVRLGTSEFYAVVEAIDGVADSLVVHLEDPEGGAGRLILLVVAPDGLDDELTTSIRTALRTQLSPRHVPDEIVAVDGLPRTLSGKKLEVPVKRILLGARPETTLAADAVANAAALPSLLETLERLRA